MTPAVQFLLLLAVIALLFITELIPLAGDGDRNTDPGEFKKAEGPEACFY